jgi:hypothetical protein
MRARPAPIKRAVLAAVLALAIAGQAPGQVQVCQGTDNCTVVSPSGHRQLSVEEARNVARDNARNNLSQVESKCAVAIDAARCRELVRELAAQFRWRR